MWTEIKKRESPTNTSPSGAAENEEQNQPNQIQTSLDKIRKIQTLRLGLSLLCICQSNNLK